MHVYVFTWTDGMVTSDPDVWTTLAGAKGAADEWAKAPVTDWIVSEHDDSGALTATANDATLSIFTVELHGDLLVPGMQLSPI